MNEVNIQNQIKNSTDINQSDNVGHTTLIDDLLDDKAFTSIENLNLIDNEDTIINSSYITDGEEKKTSFLNLLKNNNNNKNDNDVNDNDKNDNDVNDNDSQATEKIITQENNTITKNKNINIDNGDIEEVEELVNNKLLKRIESNDSLELKRHKSITKIENLECLAPFINKIENSQTNNNINITIEYSDGNKTNLNDSTEFSSKKSSYDSLNSLSSNGNSINANDSTLHNTINSNIFTINSFPSTNKSHKKDNSGFSFSSIQENKVSTDPIDLDSIFDNRGNNNSIKYNTVAKCTSLQFDDEKNKLISSNYSLKSTSESTGAILKSSLKKISMFSSEYSNLPKKDIHVHILDSVTIINPREDDKKMSLKKGAIYGFRAIRKSLSSNSVKNIGKNNNEKNNTATSKLAAVTITTECLNDVEETKVVPKQEDNHLQVNSGHSKVDKIINHCRRLSFSKLGKNSSSSNDNSSSSNKNDYRKDIEKMRKKYALVEEKPKSKYFTLMKMLDVHTSDEEFLALTSLEVYYKNIDTLPNEIGDMVNLRFLYLNDNKIRSVSPSIGNLVNLIH
eukprot:jgi/Orpsp1_1/1192567/evm.model.d7180000094274.1